MRAALIAAALALAGCDQPAANEEALGTTIIDDSAPSFVSLDLPNYFNCLRNRPATMVSAHRGGPAPGFAENSIPTFEHTLRAAPAFLEVDVSRTRDGVLVLMHDDTVDRTTTGRGVVSELTLADIKRLRLRDEDGRILDAQPPTLREALDWAASGAVLELDVKRGVSYEDVAREVREAEAMYRVIFITYSVDGASRLARVAPEAMIYTTIASISDLELLERRGVDLTHIVAWLGDEDFDAALLHALNARRVEARWGLFGRNPDFASAVDAGVQGVAVNDPVAAYRAIDAADGERGFAAFRCLGAPSAPLFLRWSRP